MSNHVMNEFQLLSNTKQFSGVSVIRSVSMYIKSLADLI